MAKTPSIQLAKTAVAKKKRYGWKTEYFSDKSVCRIVKDVHVPLNGMVCITTLGCKEEITRTELLKRELNGIAAYWRGMLATQKSGGESQSLGPPYPERAKNDAVFDYLVLMLGELWTDPRIFQQEKVGVSIADPETQHAGIRDSKARGPFIRFALACFKVLGVEKTEDAVRASIRKRPEEFKRISQEERTERRANEKRLLSSLGLSGAQDK